MEYKLKGVYLNQTSTVTKLLNEGWEPFWGYRCTRNEEDTVRMYFRKAPEPVVAQLETIESEPLIIQIDPKSVEPILDMFAGMLNDVVMDMDIARKEQSLPMRAGGTVDVSEVLEQAEKIEQKAHDFYSELDEENDDGQASDGMPDLTAEEVAADVAEAASYDESHPPAGDNFRVIDEAPDLPVQARTQKQDDVIESIRNSSDVNITVYPIDENGVVRVFAGDKVTHIYPDGRTEQEKNPAKTSSLAEGI